MKAVVYEKYGPLNVLQLHEVPPPPLEKNEILVRVVAASLNPIDWKIREGKLRWIVRPRFPRGIGSDFSGEVIGVGAAVGKFKPGDLVFGGVSPTSSNQGSLSEVLKVPEERVALKPAGVSHAEAACLGVAARSALQGLRDLGRIGTWRPGAAVMINGAGGGVGAFAVQMAKQFDAEVTAVCGAANMDLVKQLGADKVYNYKTQEASQLQGPFDIFFDVVPTTHLSRVRGSLAPRGIYVTTLPAAIDLFQAALSSFSRRKSKVLLLKSSSADLASVAEQVALKKLRVVVGQTFRLEDFKRGYEISESGHGTGKIVIEVAPS